MSYHILSDKNRQGVQRIAYTLTRRVLRRGKRPFLLRMAGYHRSRAHKRIGNGSVPSLLSWINLPYQRNREPFLLAGFRCVKCLIQCLLGNTQCPGCVCKAGTFFVRGSHCRFQCFLGYTQRLCCCCKVRSILTFRIHR